MTPEEERIWDRANVEAGELPLSWYIQKYGETKMTVDLSKMKVGDEVLVKGTLREIAGEDYRLEVNWSKTNAISVWIKNYLIVSFSTPVYEPKAGDVVEYELNWRASPTFKREVIAVHDGWLWLKNLDKMDHYIREISDLKNLRKAEP